MLIKKTTNQHFVIFFACWCAYSCVYLGRVNLAVAMPYIQKSLELSKSQIGLIGSLFFWVYGLGQLTNGYLGDKFSSKYFIFWGLFVTSITNLLFGFARTLPLMLFLWGINAYFQSMLWGPIVKLLSTWFPESQKNKISIGISTSMILGYLLAWGVSGQVIARTTWSFAFWLPGIIILLYSFIWLYVARDNPTSSQLPDISKSITSNERPITNDNVPKTINQNQKPLSFLSVFKKEGLIFIIIGCFAQGIIKDGIGLWGPTLLIETQNFNMNSSFFLILIIPLMNLNGIFFTGWLNKILKYKEKLAAIILFTIGIVSIICFLKFQYLGLMVSLIFLALSSASMYGINVILLSIIPMGFIKYNKASFVAGFLDFCSYLATAIASFSTGYLVENYGWNTVILGWIIIAILGISSLIISYRRELSIEKSLILLKEL